MCAIGANTSTTAIAVATNGDNRDRSSSNLQKNGMPVLLLPHVMFGAVLLWASIHWKSIAITLVLPVVLEVFYQGWQVLRRLLLPPTTTRQLQQEQERRDDKAAFIIGTILEGGVFVECWETTSNNNKNNTHASRGRNPVILASGKLDPRNNNNSDNKNNTDKGSYNNTRLAVVIEEDETGSSSGSSSCSKSETKIDSSPLSTESQLSPQSPHEIEPTGGHRVEL